MSLASKKRIFQTIAVVGMLNFLVFVGVALLIGGDAVNGHQSDGRYFLANHGRYTEVSRDVFTYSRVHCYTIFCSWPLIVLSAFMLQRYRKREAAYEHAETKVA